MNKPRAFLIASIGVGLVVGVVLSLYQNGWWRGEKGSDSARPLSALTDLPEAPQPRRSLGNVLDQLMELRESDNSGKKIELVQMLERGLDEDQREALLYELVTERPGGVELGGYSNYFHQICLVMVRQKEGRERYGRTLMAVVENPEREPVLRDYALQHLRKLWHFSGENLTLQRSIESAFSHLTEDKLLGPSALLSLHLLDDSEVSSGTSISYDARSNRPNPHVANDRLVPLLRKALQRTGFQEGTLAAIRIIRDRKMEGFLPELRSASLRKNSESVMVQVAAISALASFRYPEDRKLVESIESLDLRIIRVKSHALSNFENL